MRREGVRFCTPRRRGAFVVALLLLCACGAQAEDDGPWHSTTWLRTNARWAGDAVERECGVAFRTRPQVQFTSNKNLVEVLFRILSNSHLYSASDRRIAAERQVGHLGGLYDPVNDTVHVAFENLRRASHDQLRVLLAHEYAHALDHERFDLMKMQHRATSVEAAWCVVAVTEGHAEWVSKQIARKAGFADAHKSSKGESPPRHEGPTFWPANESRLNPGLTYQDRMRREFGYRDSLRFFEAVFKSNGRKGVLQVLREPPTRTELIDRPQAWLANERPDSANDTARIRDAFLPLALPPSEKYAGPVLSWWLRRQAMRLPKSMRPTFAKGFVRGHRLNARWTPSPGVLNAELSVVVLCFDTPTNAETYATHQREKHAIHIKDGVTQIRRRERVVVDATQMRLPALDRGLQDAFIKFALATEQERKAMGAPRVPPSLFDRYRDVPLRVTTPDGGSVASLCVFWRHHGKTQELEFDGERTMLRLPNDDGTLFFVRATNKNGTGAPYGPHRVTVERDAAEVSIELPSGHALRGRVLDPAGNPVANARVRAYVKTKRDAAHLHGEVRTDAAGAFRITTLARRRYKLEAADAGNVARSKPLTVSLEVRDVGPVSLRLVRTGDVRIHVTRADGTPLEFIEVRAGSRSATTDGEGFCTLVGLSVQRRYRLELRPNTWTMPDVASHVIEGWKPKHASVELDRGWVMSGTMVDRQGKPTPGQVTVETPLGLQTRHTDPKGQFRFGNLPMKTVRVAPGRVQQSDVETTVWTSVAADTTEIKLKVNAR